jgi:iron complex transport system ATP-binding protein
MKLDHFSFSYGEKPILNDITITIAQGEYTAVIGPNGAGKSTMLKCINRILKGGAGSIELFGKNIKQYSQKELGRLIGYVPQTRDHVFPYTVYEFVIMGRYPYFNPLSRVSKEDQRIVYEAMEKCGITQFSNRPIENLSGGERQKVYLAAALAQQPKILLLDEPTAHLDPKYHMEIQKTICQISEDRNMTVLHVTHDLNYLLHWSQKVIAMKEGKIHFCGIPEEILTHDHLYKTFDIHFLNIAHPRGQKNILVPEVHG